AAFHAASQGDRCSKLPRQSAHYRLLSAALESDPSRRPTLAVIRRELTGWLARSGHAEDGPVLPVNPSQQGTRLI
ncbi:MAG: serine/threonine protein kinase, partial [Sciscionella sp.]